MTDDTPLWLFADQLGPAVHSGEHAHSEVLLVEATSAFKRRRYHRQKAHIVLSALRHAHRDLDGRATLPQVDTYTTALRQFRRPVLVHEPTSHAAEKFVHRLDDACPFTAGYSAFTHRQQDVLAKNHRTARAVASMNRLADLEAVLEQESTRRQF